MRRVSYKGTMESQITPRAPAAREFGRPEGAG